MKKEKGITLIALVITIIVLLILAGVTVQTLTGDNGLLQQADKAKMLTEIGEIEEKIKLKTLENENQQLIEGSLDSIDLDISENLINKYKDIVYVKDSKLYLSFIANYPQINSYKNNKEKIEALKDRLEVTYDSIKAYNKVVNPSFNDGLNGWEQNKPSYNTIEVLNEQGNNYVNIDMKYLENGTTTWIRQTLTAEKYNDKIYINTKYRNRKINNDTDYIINIDIIEVYRKGGGYSNTLLNKNDFLDSYNQSWKNVSIIKTVYEYYGTLNLWVKLGGSTTNSSSWEYDIDFDDVYAINLTEIFGAGNEPTKEQMDEIFNNF